MTPVQRSIVAALAAVALVGTLAAQPGDAAPDGASVAVPLAPRAAPPPAGLTPGTPFSLAAVSTMSEQDGTFWSTGAVTSGKIKFTHVSNTGVLLPDTFTVAANFAALFAGTYGNRVFIADGGAGSLRSWATSDNGTGNTQAVSDGETGNRLHGEIGPFRVSAGGTLTMTQFQGSTQRIARFDVSVTDPVNHANHNWYPQSYLGTAINTGDGIEDTYTEHCEVGYTYSLDPDHHVTGTQAVPSTCSNGNSYAPTLFKQPVDSAPADGGIYVLNQNNTPDGIPYVRFTDSTGQTTATIATLLGPTPGDYPHTALGMVHDPITDHLFVSEGDFYRISEFSKLGEWLATYGYGVSTGNGSVFETCTSSQTTCKKGAANANAYFGRLYVRNRVLFAARPNAGDVLPMAIGSGVLPTNPPVVNPPVVNPPVNPPVVGPDTIGLAASATKVTKGKSVTLTATLGPTTQCSARQAQLQTLVKKRGKPATWAPVATVSGAGCSPVFTAKIKVKKVYRAVSLAGATVVATSGQVSVKPKSRRGR